MTVSNVTQRIHPLLTQEFAAYLRQAWERPFYARHWGIAQPAEVIDLVRQDRFHELPLMRKQHLRDHREEIIDYSNACDLVSSSGTTGRPVDIPVHAQDEQNRILRVRRLLEELGVGAGSRVLQLLSLNDLFTLGPITWQAIKSLQACAIRCSPKRLDRVLLAIEHVQPEFVVGNPFTLVRMAEQAGERWPSRTKLPNRAFLAVAAVFDATLAPTPVATAVSDRWGLELTINQYGTSELGPIAHECRSHRGLHIHNDHHFVELIDPDTGKPVTDPNRPGEVVLTGISLPRGFLPVRYATGDMAAWLRTGRCTCGRTSARLGPIIGRVDHQLKVYGQTIFPDLLLDLADRSPNVHRSAVRVHSGHLAEDDVSLLILPAADCNATQVREEIAEHLIQNLAVSPPVELVTQDELERLERQASQHSNMVKIPRFFDLRHQQNGHQEE